MESGREGKRGSSSSIPDVARPYSRWIHRVIYAFLCRQSQASAWQGAAYRYPVIGLAVIHVIVTIGTFGSGREKHLVSVLVDLMNIQSGQKTYFLLALAIRTAVG